MFAEAPANSRGPPVPSQGVGGKGGAARSRSLCRKQPRAEADSAVSSPGTCGFSTEQQLEHTDQNSRVMSCHNGSVLWPIGARGSPCRAVSFYRLFKETSADPHMTGGPALRGSVQPSLLFEL